MHLSVGTLHKKKNQNLRSFFGQKPIEIVKLTEENFFEEMKKTVCKGMTGKRK